jgi:DNA replication and repair protein RecF
MHLSRLELEEFRAYRHLALELAPRGLRLHGPNASGKSTLLEGASMLATTRSPRTSADREAIAWKSGEEYGVPPYARLRGEISRSDGEAVVELALEVDPAREGMVRKQIRLGGRQVRAADAVGKLKAVLFSAEDVDLVAGPPAGRRRYLDLAISQLDGRYIRALTRFNRILAERNSLLKAFARDRVQPDAPAVAAQLAFWDEELVAFGAQVMAYRAVALRRLNALARARFAWLAAGSSLELCYRSSLELTNGIVAGDGTLETVQALIVREYEEALTARRRDEIRRGATLLGPHRDDLGFVAEGIDLATFGSRGQQRLAVVALKLAETDLMAEDAGEPPVLLLDDVLSELDAERRQMLIEAIARPDRQVIITATDVALLKAEPLRELPLARVEGGAIVFESTESK